VLRRYINSKILCFFNLHKYEIGIRYYGDDRYDECSVCERQRIVRDIVGASMFRMMCWAMNSKVQKRKVIIEKIDNIYPTMSPKEHVISWIVDEDYI